MNEARKWIYLPIKSYYVMEITSLGIFFTKDGKYNS